MQCARHPQVETFVTCFRCGTPICYRCQVPAEVGILCPTHGRRVPLAQYAVSPLLYARGAAASALLGSLGGLGLRYVVEAFPLLGRAFLGLILLGFALGYVMGEGVGRAAGGKAGRGLQAIAIGGVALAMFVGLGWPLLFSLPGTLGLVVGVVVAWGRLR